ncbi:MULTISPECIES: transketolase C-terminal domain-containing protein [unclassified Microbacterium]|uniref:transketolase family protein n=1 Tax=unclassified Microbacterium TaxID=2609290 RepID=UPI00214A9C05|nr:MULTISPECIES: transketolase C-terminal domain-containing protein [unclassified Microbacterium]MCR2808477.1 transketolase family protein [Microbacterium sp. zg.B185]WIM19083.1 transketolase C-terminal domain-containing protein [Microbacterium sp. zg-B185]
MPVTFTFGEMLSARSVIGTTLAELGDEHENLWVLTPDIGATLVEFRDKFPERFLDVGLAEQVCVGIAAGLAYDGNIPVVSGMLPFLSMRALEQVRSDVCYPNLPVKIIGTHGGLVGNGGSTHYAVEDLALMCALTNMTVTSVGDPLMVGEVIRQSMSMEGPIYIRLAVGKKDKVLYEPGQHEVRIGKGIVAREGTDATIFTHGTVVAQALDAADELAKDGRSVRVVDMFTLKPIDEELIAQCAAETGGRFVVLEDHLAYGGLASRIADVVADRGIHLSAFERLGIPQVYAGFGEDEELRDKHGYGLAATVAAARSVIAGGQ